MPPAIELVVVNGYRAPRGDLRELVSRRYPARSLQIDEMQPGKAVSHQGFVFDVDLGSRQRAEDARVKLKEHLDTAAFRVCIVDDPNHTILRMRAQSLGADTILGRPLQPEQFYDTVDRLMASATEKLWRNEFGSHAPALIAGTDALNAMFEFARHGAPMTSGELAEKSETIIDTLARTGLASWIGAVRSHHGQTYHHCLLITGVAVSFGQHLGMRRADLNRLAVAGLLHDIGKAGIPVDILEKPGPLTTDEMRVMRTHPTVGAEVLRRAGQFPHEMIDVVKHHHEYLDGSGYPDGLQGDEISDLVRMVTIADIFGALIETRSYKPAMSSRKAYSIIKEMGPKLDLALVRAFESVAMQIGPVS